MSTLVLFESADKSVSLSVPMSHDTVWLTKDQMATLFGRDRTVVSRHIANVYREGELEREGTCAKNAKIEVRRCVYIL